MFQCAGAPLPPPLLRLLQPNVWPPQRQPLPTQMLVMLLLLLPPRLPLLLLQQIRAWGACPGVPSIRRRMVGRRNWSCPRRRHRYPPDWAEMSLTGGKGERGGREVSHC